MLLALIVFVWSSFAWCFMPPQQSRLAAIAPDMVALALALNAAMIYAGIAVGSAIAARDPRDVRAGGAGHCRRADGVLALLHLLGRIGRGYCEALPEEGSGTVECRRGLWRGAPWKTCHMPS